MRRVKVRPYGSTVRPTRVMSMLLMLGVLWLLYQQFKNPAFWSKLVDAKEPAVEEQVTAQQAPEQVEVPLIVGPNDLDEEEVADAKEMMELVTDKVPLRPREMHAYWRLLGWSHTQSFADLQKRAKRDVAFTQLWEQPEKYRGKPVTMRLHVRRVLEYDAPKNPYGFKKTYEAWGWTDESRSFPYVVVFTEPPPGLPIGTDVRAEVVFVGYFLKIMSYTAFEQSRGAPLLLGQAQMAPLRVAPPAPPPDPTTVIMVVAGAAVFIALAFLWQLRSRKRRRSVSIDDPPIQLDPTMRLGESDSTPLSADLVELSEQRSC